MKTIHRFNRALSLAAALIGATALAQGSRPVVGVGVGAGTNVGVGIGGAGSSIGGTGTVGGAVRGGVNPGGAFGASGEAFESIGMRQERIVAERDAAAHASTEREAHARTVASLAASGAAASLGRVETSQAIRTREMAKRAELMAELQMRTDASAKAMAEVRKSGVKLEGEERANFNAASAEVKATEKALKKSMKVAEKADASAWTDARAKLAADYEAHASAVAKAEAASRIGAQSTAKAAEKPAEKPKG